MRTAVRYYLNDQSDSNSFIGFRCARSANGEDEAVMFQATPTPRWVSYLFVRKPTINDIRDMESIWDTNVLEVGDISSPGTRYYYGMAGTHTEYLWPYSWCTTDNALLEQNTSELDVKLYIDDEQLSEEYVFNYNYDTSTSWYCSYWAIVFEGLRRGIEVKFEVSYSIRERINDGQTEYLPGDYIHQLMVILE